GTQDLEAARAACEQIENETLPEFAGLSLDARRAINLAAIAYGQVLCDRLEQTGLVELAREAASRREPPREDYGDRARCDATMVDIGNARNLLQTRTSLTPE